MDGDASEFLNVREASGLLAVHPNTIRNWVKEGRLGDARVPGTRFLRVRRAEVERLQRKRGSAATSLKAERLNFNPELADAGQLRRWALDRSKDAQQNFPELIRRLLVETRGISGVSVRSGDGVALPGWDGEADSEGTAPFLPKGRLRFEIGIERPPSSKAQRDYDKRVHKDERDEVFVFVTPHRWAAKASWAAERKRERRFVDVRVLDADDIEGWLRTAPAAHYWFSEHLGLAPRDAQVIEDWWARFSKGHKPVLPEGLFLAGRAAEAEVLRGRLQPRSATTGGPTLTTVQSEWMNDCLAFIHASLRHPDDLAKYPDQPVLLVSSRMVWERVIEQPGRATLIPLFSDPDVGRALDAGHQVVSVIDRGTAARRAIDISLPRPSRPDARAAFEAVAIDHQQADRLAVLARRSMPAMARSLSLNPAIQRPTWAAAPDARSYALLSLIGAWTTSDGDQAAIQALTGCSGPDIERLVDTALDSADPLLRQVGHTITVASPEEAFWLLRDSLSLNGLRRWLDEASKILTEPDPALDLPPDERHLASIRGLKRRVSSTLAHGVAQGLALLGAMGETTSPDGRNTLSEVTSARVRQLLVAATSERTGRQLQLLAPVMPLLAEAAPAAFLDVVSRSLADPDPVVLSMFKDAEDPGIWGPSSPHPHLLWALETLCWSDDFLVDAARALAQIAAAEPGGKSGNRPASSLATVLTGWVRHTSASWPTRLRALDAVLVSAEEVGWQLVRDLWPRRNAWTMPPASPRFREGWTQVGQGVPMSEWFEFVGQLVDRILQHAGTDAVRLGQLVERLSSVSPEDRNRMLDHLESSSTSDSLEYEGRALLWEQLQTIAARHRRFPDAEWSMAPETVDRLSAIATALNPTAGPSKFAYLFDWHPDLEDVEITDWEKYQDRLGQLRLNAIATVLSQPSWKSDLASLAGKAKAKSQLGWTFESFDEIDDDLLIGWLREDDSTLREVAWHTIQARFSQWHPAYLNTLLARPDLTGDARADVFRAIPPRHEYWDALERSGNAEDVATYWSTASIEVVPVLDSARAIDRLIDHRRAWSAIAVASFALYQHHQSPATGELADLDAAAVIRVLMAPLQTESPESDLSQMTSHYVGELLDFLIRKGVDDSVVAGLEFQYFQLLEHDREPVALSRALARHPDLFVDLVTRVYRAKDEPASEKSTRDSQLASHAWAVLNGWTGHPGRREDGTTDADGLMAWVVQARLLLSESNRADIGDEVIGESFGHSPAGGDGVWPAEPVRDLVERIGSTDLENGLVIGKLNSRGVTTRGVYDGGIQERRLAAQYRDWSIATKEQWPRTSRILRRIADDYERDARREDVEAEIDADRW